MSENSQRLFYGYQIVFESSKILNNINSNKKGVEQIMLDAF